MLHAFVGEDDDAVRDTVRQPMKDYLRSSIGLIKKAAWSFPTFKQKTTGEDGQFTTEHLSDEAMEEVLEFSFERYYETSGLFGTPERCLEQVADTCALGASTRSPACSTSGSTPNACSTISRCSTKCVSGRIDRLRNRGRQPIIQLPHRSSVMASHICSARRRRRACSLPTRRPGRRSGGVEHLMVGGETLSVELAKTLQAIVPGTVTNMYGPTETTIWSTTHRIEA